MSENIINEKYESILITLFKLFLTKNIFSKRVSDIWAISLTDV
jgi:hypothetical protein